MWRAIVLSLGLMLSLGIVVPLLTDSTEAGPKQHKKYRKIRYKKYSKAWWRAYHRRERRRKALVARKRALRLRQETLAREVRGSQNLNAAGKTAAKEKVASAVLPSGKTAPASWKQDSVSRSAQQFRVNDAGGNSVGSAAITVVGPAMGADSDSYRNKAVGGVSTSALRRTVIDRMMKEDGWVVNDYQKDINGKKVYVVVAQSRGAGNQVQARLFYFTEVEGKIYSVATSSPNESSEQIARESENVVRSLQNSSRSAQAELR